MCDMFAEQFLPEVFEELDAILKDAKQVRSYIFSKFSIKIIYVWSGSFINIVKNWNSA